MATATRPQPGQEETRQAPEVTTEGRRIRGVIPYNIESRDMGGWSEIIEPTAFRTTTFDDLVATVDHAGVPIGRHPTTLALEDRSDGLHWSVDPPRAAATFAKLSSAAISKPVRGGWSSAATSGATTSDTFTRSRCCAT